MTTTNGSPHPRADDGDGDDAEQLGIRLALANAPAFAAMTHQWPHDRRVEFTRAFLACLSGITQQAIGHDATVAAFSHVAGLGPVDATLHAH